MTRSVQPQPRPRLRSHHFPPCNQPRQPAIKEGRRRALALVQSRSATSTLRRRLDDCQAVREGWVVGALDGHGGVPEPRGDGGVPDLEVAIL